jgi:hypothetical protein
MWESPISGDGVDDDDVDGGAADEDLGDLEGLLAGVGLGDEEVVGLYAEVPGVADVEGVLGVDEGGDAAPLLGLGDDVEGQRRLARRFRPVDLHHPAAGDAADAEGDVEAQGSRGDHLDGRKRVTVPEAHDGALAELFFDLAQGHIESFFLAFLCPAHRNPFLLSAFAGEKSPVQSFFSTVRRTFCRILYLGPVGNSSLRMKCTFSTTHFPNSRSPAAVISDARGVRRRGSRTRPTVR